MKAKKFLVAVSGGPDSLALAAMCKIFELNNKKKKFYYTHINHGIRKNSSLEAERVKKILKKQSISLKIISNKIKIINNVQHNARKIRYSIFNKECKSKKINIILTGHHKDDQIETFFIRLSRGSGVQGLSAMNSISKLDSKVKIFRPFLANNKNCLIFVTKKLFGTYIKDPSNNNKKYLRSNIRKLIPLLNKYGIGHDQIIKSINNLKSSSRTLNIYFKEELKKTLSQKGKKIIINRKIFFSLNKEIQIKILGHAIKLLNKLDYPPRAKKILTALKSLNSKVVSKHSLGGCLLNSSNNQIFVEKSSL